MIVSTSMKKEPGLVVGRAPELLQQFIEVRGIGIINVVEMFGARAYRHKKRLRDIND